MRLKNNVVIVIYIGLTQYYIILYLGDFMDKNKIIIIALIVIIAALLVGLAAMMMPNMAKQDTKLKFKSNSTLTEGDSLKVKLTDANGTALANQTVNVTVTNKDGSSDYHSVVTNEKGVGTLKLDKNPGNYNITVSYSGNDKYKECNATKKITIEEQVAEAQVDSTSSSSSSNNDPGAYYSRQSLKTYYTGDIVQEPGGGYMRHLGNNRWEPV